MKKKMINTYHLEGWLYDHDLSIKKTGPNSKNPGTEFISGTVSIAADAEMTNIISIHYSYITAVSSNGKADTRFITLNNIINGTIKTAMGSSKAEAAKVTVDSAVDLNEFYSNRSGTEELVSAIRNEGGFIHVNGAWNEKETERNKFTCDMLVTKTRMVEADPENNTKDRMYLSGVIFNFRNEILPVQFVTYDPTAFNYFSAQEVSASNPLFTKVWGAEVSTVVIQRTVEEAAFGEDSVHEVKKVTKEFVVTGSSVDAYEWNTPDTLTLEDITKAQQDREIKLAQLKERSNKPTAATPAAQANTGAVPTFAF